MTQALPPVLLEPIVRAALAEDLGRAGDITTDAVVDGDRTLDAVVAAREPGVVSGIAPARLTFALLDAGLQCTVMAGEGTRVGANAPILHLHGPARAILTGERVALNFLTHLSGIATATAGLVDAVRPHGAKVTCTRKTTPGLRALEKCAVAAGGGVNHRFGLDDAMLVKDNHIACAGSVDAALRRARAAGGHMVKLEVEVDTLDQLDAALPWNPDVILLDNMAPDTLRAAVARIDGRAIVEASGGITLANAADIAATGVDTLAVGWLTHSAPALDVGLDIRPT
jgi:nicotinate-nucleotide pyrophosphorylase (carboxylating)